MNKRIPILIIATIVLFVALSVWYSRLRNSSQKTIRTETADLNDSAQLPQVSPAREVPASEIFAKVGDEYLYKKDLDYALSSYPQPHTEEIKTAIISKLVNDSKTLQAAKDQGIIQLDQSVFNSPEIDLAKRGSLVEKVNETVKNEADGISGSIIAVWFLNNHVGSLGYERAKEMALNKINALHTSVVNKEMTIEEAAERIKNDASLAQLDPQYKTNAILNFKVTKGKRITWDQSFDDALWSLAQGAVTDVFTGESQDMDNDGREVEAYYTFGQVKQRIKSGKIGDLATWNSEKDNKYAVEYFK